MYVFGRLPPDSKIRPKSSIVGATGECWALTPWMPQGGVPPHTVPTTILSVNIMMAAIGSFSDR